MEAGSPEIETMEVPTNVWKAVFAGNVLDEIPTQSSPAYQRAAAGPGESGDWHLGLGLSTRLRQAQGPPGYEVSWHGGFVEQPYVPIRLGGGSERARLGMDTNISALLCQACHAQAAFLSQDYLSPDEGIRSGWYRSS